MVYDVGDTSDELGNCVCNTLTLYTVFVTSSIDISSRQGTSETHRSLTEGLIF